MVAGEGHSKFGVQISYCGRQRVLPQCTAQLAAANMYTSTLRLP